MGIKFHCPNGHKMHVKSFLAGKKGVCPKCGVRIEIPLVSDADAPPASALEPDAFEPDKVIEEPGPIEVVKPQTTRPRGPAFGLDLSAPREPTATQKAPGPAASKGAGVNETAEAPLELADDLDLEDDLSALAPQPTSRAPAGRADPAWSQSNLPPSGPSPPAASGVSRQASSASWYASLANGTTAGPMSAAAVLRGLDQGQFTTDSLVWRDGWSQWQPLGSVLSQMNAPTQPVGQAALSPIKADDPLAEALGRQIPAPSTPMYGRRRTRKELRARVSMILMILVIILFALMMYVLSMKHD
jgi:hypothetical protein